MKAGVKVSMSSSSVPIMHESESALQPSLQSLSNHHNSDLLVKRTLTARNPINVLDLVKPVLTAKERNESEDSSTEGYIHSPSVVSNRVVYWLQKWGRTIAVPPEQFLNNILKNRGYDTRYIFSVNSQSRRPPSLKQLQDYDNELVWAIRNSDMEQLKCLYSQGRCMTACNRFSESIVHMACRRASIDIVRFLIAHEADIAIVDDYGRIPLHDACWRPEPRFDIVTTLLDANLDLLRYSDVRGFVPLHYVREDHWLQWCAYLFNQIEKYWAPRIPEPEITEETRCAESTVAIIEDEGRSSTQSDTHRPVTSPCDEAKASDVSDEPKAKRQRVEEVSIFASGSTDTK